MAVIEYSFHRDKIAVLCNAYYPVLAFTDNTQDRFGSIHFVEAGRLAQSFAKITRFTPLNIQYLQHKPVPFLLEDLDEVEHKQIQYWKPKQVGDIIFNHWD